MPIFAASTQGISDNQLQSAQAICWVGAKYPQDKAGGSVVDGSTSVPGISLMPPNLMQKIMRDMHETGTPDQLSTKRQREVTFSFVHLGPRTKLAISLMHGYYNTVCIHGTINAAMFPLMSLQLLAAASTCDTNQGTPQD